MAAGMCGFKSSSLVRSDVVMGESDLDLLGRDGTGWIAGLPMSGIWLPNEVVGNGDAGSWGVAVDRIWLDDVDSPWPMR
ncbi:MAG TPA: hypothetical protein VN455_01230 [Methanotrichaceae archaeon]|nr:hypothetical protein [Methanotrichaceae archaeon]